jgi:hypothetical protein
MADDLDQVFPDIAGEEAPVVDVSPEPEPIEEPQNEPELPGETVGVQEEVVAPVAPEPVRPDPGFVPLSAVLDEREKRKALEARIAQFEQERQTQQPSIDPFDDPEGFARQQTGQVQEQMTAMRFQFSDQFAREKHGPDSVDAAIAWAGERARADQVFAASYMQQQDPIGWIVQQHKRDGMLSQIGDRSIDDFVKDYIAKNPALVGQIASVADPAPAVVQPKQAATPVKVPRSLATQGSGPSDVREVATGPLAGVDAVFNQ